MRNGFFGAGAVLLGAYIVLGLSVQVAFSQVPVTSVAGTHPEILKGACAYSEKRYADALTNFLSVRSGGVSHPDLPLFIARSNYAQYKDGDKSPKNVVIGRATIAAYAHVIGNDKYDSEAAWAMADLHLEINAERLPEIAASTSTPTKVRSSLYSRLASRGYNCAWDIVGAVANQTSVRINGVVTKRYKMPTRRGDFDAAKKCAEDGLASAEKGLALDAKNSYLWSTKSYLLEAFSHLSEMANDPAGKQLFAKEAAAARSEYKRLSAEEKAEDERRYQAELATAQGRPGPNPDDLKRFIETGEYRREPDDFLKSLVSITPRFVPPPDADSAAEKEQRAEAAMRAAKRPWKTFAPSGYRFSVAAPSPLESGSAHSGAVLHFVTSENVDYFVTTMKVPSSMPNVDARIPLATATWGNSVSICNFAVMGNSVCEVKFVRELNLTGNPGRQYSLNQSRCSSNIPGALRVYMNKDEIVLLQSIGADERDPNVKRFLDSLVLN